MKRSFTKRMISLFMCVMMLLSVLPGTVFATENIDASAQDTEMTVSAEDTQGAGDALGSENEESPTDESEKAQQPAEASGDEQPAAPSEEQGGETLEEESLLTVVTDSLSKGSSIAGTDYHVTSVKQYAIAPDVSERVIITNNTAGNSQTVANVMEVNPSNGRAKIVTGYGNRNPKELGWTLKTTTAQAHLYEQETGLNVVGGVNASWFNINTGEPSGYLVMNGVVHHDNSSRAYVAAFDDGSVNVFKEGTTLAQAEASQSAKQGKEVKILEAVDALVAMVWDGKVVISQSGNGGYYPRTCVGVKEDGTVVLFQADGTMAPRSVGYTAAEEANMMVALGCVAAIQLDEAAPLPTSPSVKVRAT